MKKVVVLFAAFVLLTLNQAAFAYRASDFSNDSKIVAAITLLEQAGETDVLRNLQKHAIRVSFDDLTSYTYNASKAYAISTYNNYGTYLLRKYYEDPTLFSNNYKFIHEVVPGFYFKMTSGMGAMTEINKTSLFVYFRYQVNSDSIANVNTSFAGTEEVLQTTRFGSDKTRLQQIARDPNCTYLKTPAGLFTELTLPVEDIVDGHDNDTIVSAKISMHRVLNNHSSDYSLPVPSRLLMIPRDSLYSFFENNNITDNKLSYQTSYSTSTGYTFNNISGIIKAMNAARKSGNYSENWNKVVLVPVSITTSKLSSTETITRVTHEMTMTSTKLVGGEDNVNDPITISIIYGKFDGR